MLVNPLCLHNGVGTSDFEQFVGCLDFVSSFICSCLRFLLCYMQWEASVLEYVHYVHASDMVWVLSLLTFQLYDSSRNYLGYMICPYILLTLSKNSYGFGWHHTFLLLFWLSLSKISIILLFLSFCPRCISYFQKHKFYILVRGEFRG